MRELKFRGKRLDNGEWAYGYLVSLDAVEVDPQTVGEYTGLKDKNGKEIYEGDIFPCTYVLDGHKDHVYAVAYDLEVAGFRLEHYGAICPQTHVVQSIRDVSRFNACLGNIYENPELLE